MNTNSLATHFYKTDPVKNLHTNIFIDKVCTAKILRTIEAFNRLCSSQNSRHQSTNNQS